LSAQLSAYQNLYNQLFKDLVESENSKSLVPGEDESDPSTEMDRLTTQLDIVAQRIEDLTNQINEAGGGSDGNIERDRLESNLALYRQTYAGLVQSYEQVRLSEIQSTSRVDLVQPAPAPRFPIRPNVSRNAMLGSLVGLMVGAGIAFLIELLDDTVKGPGEIVHRLRLPVLGYIMRMEEDAEYPVTALEPRSPLAESFRSLRTNIQYASVDRPLFSLMVTSPTPQDGKSTVAANLGVVLAQMQHKVGLIDADLRRPFQHKIFNLPNRIGLCDSLVRTGVNLNGNFKETEVENLTILTTGDLPPNPSELVGSDKMLGLILGLESSYDIVIIDTPPVMAVTDPVVLSTRIDGVIIILRPGITKLAAAIQTVDQMRQVGANILGVVLNDVENKGARYSQYYKGYYYQYGKYYDYSAEGKKKKKRKPLIKGTSNQR
jgi:non-specific protein-tyrosine kinase